MYSNQNVTGPSEHAGIPKTEKQTPEIELCFRTTESAVEGLMKSVSALSARIQPVCRPSEPTPVKDVAGQRPQRMSGLAERLQAIHDQILNQASQISNLTDRVEI